MAHQLLVVLHVHWAVRLKNVQTERRRRSLSLPLSSSSPIRLCSFPLSFQRITLSSHTLDCKLIEHKPNTCYKCPMDGLSSHSQLPLILGHRFPTEKNAIICIWLHMFPSPASSVLLEQDQCNRQRIFLIDDPGWPIQENSIYLLYAKYDIHNF